MDQWSVVSGQWSRRNQDDQQGHRFVLAFVRVVEPSEILQIDFSKSAKRPVPLRFPDHRARRIMTEC